MIEEKFNYAPLNINIDVDNTVNDYIQRFCYFVSEIKGTPFTPAQNNDYDLCKTLGISRKVLETMFFKNNEFYRGLQPLYKSVDVIRDIVEAGHNVKFVTAINYEVVDARIEFIRRYFPFVDVDKALIVTNDKYSISSNVVIDDYPENLRNSNEFGCKYILFRQPWNMHIKQGHIATNWEDVRDYLKQFGVL